MMKYEWQLSDKSIAHEIAYGEAETLEEAMKAADAAAIGFEGRYKLAAYSDDEEWFRFRHTAWQNLKDRVR